jgi:hypothetical protein
MLSRTSKTCPKKRYTTKIGRRGNVVPFPSKTPFGRTKIQKLPHVSK